MALDPDALAATSFPTVRRGVDPDAVKKLLTTVADELRQLRASEATLQADLAAARTQGPVELDEAQVADLLGPETARVLSAAREAAAEIRAKAAERAERLERDAETEAARVRADADAVAARRREQADADVDAARAEAAGVRADAEADAQRRREEADAEVEARRAEAEAIAAQADADAQRRAEEADAEVEARRAAAEVAAAEAEAEAQRRRDELDAEVEAGRAAAEVAAAEAEAEAQRRRDEVDAEVAARRTEAEAIAADAEQAAAAAIEDAKAEGRRLVIEAQAVRERVLADMARRRTLAREQIAILESGRDRIVAAYAFVRASVDEASEELRVAVDEARELLAADDDAGPSSTSSGSMALGELDEDGGDDDVIARLQELAGTPSSDLPTTMAMPVVGGPGVDQPLDGEPHPGADAAADAAAEVEEAEQDLDDLDDLDRGDPIADGPAAPAVEALFARIRSSRAEVVARAQEVLDADEGDDAEAEVDPARAWVRERAAVLDPVERNLARRLKRALADEESAMLDVLRRQRSAQVEELVGSADEQADRLRATVRGHLVEAVAAGEAFSRAQSDQVRPVDPDPLLGPVLDELVADLVTPLRARVAAAVSETGGNTDDLSAPLRAAYREWKTQRLDRAASHAALAAFGAGALEALVPGTPVRWAVEPAEGACPDGEDNALAGIVAAGDSFPTGHRHAPAHSTCRCQVVPADHQ